MGVFMTVRSIIGLFLGLVLQVYLVVPAGACVATERCEMRAGSCSCCEGGKSCPCATNTDGGTEAPVPATAPSQPKVDVIAPTSLAPVTPVAARAVERERDHDLPPVATGGYRGVGLCVSFCRLVI